MMTHEAGRGQPATAERTATAYRVRNWDDVFENAQSRKQKRLAWVPVPNKHDGKSFRRLMGMENGPALYGAWVVLLQVASKCPERGILADEDGPLTPDDIAMKTGLPDSLIVEALQTLASSAIRWLDTTSVPLQPAGVVTHYHCDTTPIPLQPAEVALKGREEKERKGSEKNTDAADAAGDCDKAAGSETAKASPVEFPPTLDTPEARAAFDEWQEHRKQLRKKLTPLAQRKLLMEWIDKGVDRFVAAVNHSIANGWQGLFEPNNGNRSQGSAQPELMGSLNRFVEAGGDE